MTEHFETRSPSPVIITRENPKKIDPSFFGELFRFALLVFIIVLPIRLFIAQPFVVSGASMEPAFLDGEYLIVDEVSYRFKKPERGDVIVFKFQGNGSYLIKRIIGLPNEEVSVRDGVVTITNGEHPEGLRLDESYLGYKMDRPESSTIELGPTSYFVMGDNRPKSADSRMWGSLEASQIVGRPFLRLLPLKKIDVLPGKVTLGE